MSVNFEEPVNEETKSKLLEQFGPPVAEDGQTFLYDKMQELRQQAMKEIANTAGQPVTVALHKQGEIKTMSDGTQYEVTPQGWRRVEEKP